MSVDSGELEGILRAAPRAGGLASQRALADVEAALFDRPARPVTLSRYVLLESIGAGGAGLVLAAYDPQLDRKIAVKLLQASRRTRGSDTDGRLRLLREAQSLAQLSHPNVIAVHDVGTYTEDDLGGAVHGIDIPRRGVFMVMELVDGPTLREWISRARTWRESLDVMLAAAEGLIAAHAQGLVHRDFKLANVLVGNDGRVRVVDFGLARPLAQDEPSGPVNAADIDAAPDRLTRTGLVIGTPLYMAPEQHTGTPATELSDQFSFCACLYEMVFGQRPYEGSGLEDLAAAKHRGPLPPPSRRAVPGRLRSAIVRGLSPEPQDRFASMAALRDELTRLRSQRRRIVTVAGLVGVSAVGVVAFRLSAPDDACRAHEEQLAGVWDEARRVSMREAFVASGAPSSAEAWERTEALASAYADEWVQLRQDACRAAVSGASTPDAMEATVQCLDRRLSALGETLDVLGVASASTVRNAPAALAQLAPLTSCAGDTPDRYDALPPPGPRREHALEVAQRLDRGRALKIAARFADARSELDAAVAVGQEIDHAPSLVRSLLERANLSHKMGQLSDAADDTHRALVAAERSGHRFLVDEVLVWRVALDGYLRSRHGPADRLIEQLEARFAHEPPEPKILMNFETVVALLRNDEGRLDDARAHVRAALELRAHMRPVQIANAVSLEANILLSQGDLEAARAGHEEALARRRAVYGNTHDDTAQSVANLALVDQLSGDLDAAVRGMERALAIQREVWGPGHVNLAQTLNNLGVTWGKKGDPERALEYFRRAHLLFVEHYGEQHMISARGSANLAAMLNNLGRYAEALERAQLALAVLEEIVEPDHIARSEALFASGVARLGLGDKSAGQREVEQARAIYERQEVRDPAREQYLYADLDEVLQRDG